MQVCLPAFFVWNLQFSLQVRVVFSKHSSFLPQNSFKRPCDTDLQGQSQSETSAKMKNRLNLDGLSLLSILRRWQRYQSKHSVNERLDENPQQWFADSPRGSEFSVTVLTSIRSPLRAASSVGPPGEQDHAAAIICAQTTNGFWVRSCRVFLDSLWLQLHPPPQCFHFVPHLLSMI